MSQIAPQAESSDSQPERQHIPNLRSSGPKPPSSPMASRSGTGDNDQSSSAALSSTKPTGSAPTTPTKPRRSANTSPIKSPSVPPRTPLSVVEEADGTDSDPAPSPSWWDKHKNKVALRPAPKGKEKPLPVSISEDREDETQTTSDATPPASAVVADVIPINRESGPVYIDSVRTKRMSTG